MAPALSLARVFDHQIDTGALQTFLGLEWIEACRKAKLKPPSLEHGVDVQKGKRLPIMSLSGALKKK